MANTITIGRISFTSPRALAESSMPADGKNSLERNVAINGILHATTIAEAKYLRDELISMSNSNLIVPFTYEGDTTFEGYCQLDSADINTAQLFGKGLFRYSLNMLIKGRAGETSFESNMTGSMLTNAHSYSATNGPIHFLPVNAYNYSHSEAPTSHVRATSGGNVYGFYDTNLRNANAKWLVNPSEYYKGAGRITIDSRVRTGYLTQNNPQSVVLDNGIIEITSGAVTDQSRFTLKFYDNGEFVSQREISISSGSSFTEWNVWKSVQILRNDAEEASVRFETYSETAGDGKLTVDVSVRRGMHHASFVATQSATSTRAAASRINSKLVTANTVTAGTYDITETASDNDGQKFFIYSPMGVTTSASNRNVHITSAQYKFMCGYEIGSNSLDTGASVFDNYMNSVYEKVRLVRS